MINDDHDPNTITQRNRIGLIQNHIGLVQKTHDRWQAIVTFMNRFDMSYIQL